MTGPRIEQVPDETGEVTEASPWVARCCLSMTTRNGTVTYHRSRADAWLALANHVQSTHGITLPVEPPAAPTAPTIDQGALL